MYNECEHDLIFVKRKTSNGSYRLSKQCIICGYHETKAYKHSVINNDINSIKYLDEDALFLYEQKRHENYLIKCKNEWNKKREADEDKRLLEFNEKKKKWFKLHSEYLKSIKWKLKRNAVLKRDNYKCQACLTQEATQVHHLTYERWRNEPLFDLISVCSECHKKIHKSNEHV